VNLFFIKNYYPGLINTKIDGKVTEGVQEEIRGSAVGDKVSVNTRAKFQIINSA